MEITSQRGSRLAGIALAFAVLGAGELARGQPPTVDATLPAYKKAAGVSGTIRSIGSDTMNNLIAEWCQGFIGFYPDVKKEVNGPGSGKAIVALVEGTADFGPMSREAKTSEIEAFEKKFGYKPVLLPVSIDMLAVFVHKDCPLESLTLQRIDAIYSKNRKGGHKADIRTWGDLGVKGAWASKPISLYGRDSISGTNQFFKEVALFNGDYKDTVKEQPGTSAVVRAVAADKYGIGYGGMGYLTSDVKALAIADEADGEPVPCLAEFAYDGTYPLTRSLYIAVNYKPGRTLDPLRREFIEYIFSKQGQTDVLKQQFLPVLGEDAIAALKTVGVE